MLRVAALALLSIALFARAAWAGPVTLSAIFTEGLISTAGAPGCNQSTTGSTSLSATCAHNMSAATVTGHFTGDAFTSMVAAGTLTFHAYSDLSIWATSNTGTPGTISGNGYVAGVATQARVNDAVIVSAGVIQSGFLRFTFDVTGSITRWSDPNTFDGFNPVTLGLSGINGGSGSSVASLSINGVGASFVAGQVVVLDVPLPFGGPQNLEMVFNTSALGQLFSNFQGFRVLTDFDNTAALVNTAILDPNKNVIPGATLTSESGFNYQQDVQAVPEPASVALVSLGFVAMLFARRRRSQA